MKRFMDKDFLLETDTARELFHGIAAALPICDFHCHIPAEQIAENAPFESITQVWLGGDHYKWRAMRIAGVPERCLTGNAPDEEKFMAFAKTMPKLIGNPLYHWTHLELQRYFGIYTPLTEKTAPEIYRAANEKIKKLTPQALIKQSNVSLLCTTDDAVDSLAAHQQLAGKNDSGASILPAFRPDKALSVEASGFSAYITQLEGVVGYAIADYETLTKALRERIEFFHKNGCRLSDHGLGLVPTQQPSEKAAQQAFSAAKQGAAVDAMQADAYRATLLSFLAAEYSRLGWTMQLHIGATRNNNVKMFEQLGPDTGFDAIGDASVARELSALLAAFAKAASLPRMLLFSINDKDNYALAALAGALQRDGVANHVGVGPAWWFHDQKEGMEKHLKELASVSVLSEFVGMTTDSRSLLSYTRHEYFRRILCNQLGRWVENGEYPKDEEALKMLLERICFQNAIGIFADVMK